MATITVNRTVQVAHRLSGLPGKCQNIHGHSMTIFVAVDGKLNKSGILEGIDFGNLKERFDTYLNTCFDHHLLLNRNDPILALALEMEKYYPGLVICPADPTVENLAGWIACDMVDILRAEVMSSSANGKVAMVEVVETDSNSVTWRPELDGLPKAGLLYARI